jgi:hypothetical protein
MASKDANRMACYILSADHEREGLISQLKEVNGNRSIKRKVAKNHIFWVAVKTYYGLKEAEKILSTVIAEACFDQDEGRSYYRRILGEEGYAISKREFLKRMLGANYVTLENSQVINPKIYLQGQRNAGSANNSTV